MWLAPEPQVLQHGELLEVAGNGGCSLGPKGVLAAKARKDSGSGAIADIWLTGSGHLSSPFAGLKQIPSMEKITCSINNSTPRVPNV